VLEAPLFMQGNTYAARRLRELVGFVFDVEGVISPETGALKVGPRAAGANRSVDVAAGTAAILGDDAAGQGMYLAPSTAIENLPIGEPPGSDSRIDLVIARIRDAAVTGGVSSDWLLEVLPGTVAAAPVEPALPPSAIRLGAVKVVAGTTSITAAMITDRRVAATNTAYVAKAGGTMTGLLTADAGLLSAPQRVFDRFVGTAESSTSTTFVALPTLLERDFTVPPSERIVVLLRADIVNSSTGLSLMSFDVFEPATNTVISVPSDDRSIYVQGTDRISLGAAVLVILAGHAGKSFRLRERVRVTAGTGTWQRRQLTYVPSL
jgi:hypothetical protein